MNLKQLQQAAKILEKIKALDAEIIEIDRVALLVANGNSECSFSLNVKDTTPVKEEVEIEEQPRDTMTDFYRRYQLGILSIISTEPKKEEKGFILNHTLSEENTLRILGILLGDRQQKRDELINKLNKKGVQL